MGGDPSSPPSSVPPGSGAPPRPPGAETVAGGDPPAPEGEPGAAPPWLRRLAGWSALSAFAATVPVPLLDDHLVKLCRRRMTRELARERGLELGASEIAHLSGTESRVGVGCLVTAAVGLVVRVLVALVRRFFRTVLFWLTLKDAADAASFTFHEGFLLRIGLEGVAATGRLRVTGDGPERGNQTVEGALPGSGSTEPGALAELSDGSSGERSRRPAAAPSSRPSPPRASEATAIARGIDPEIAALRARVATVISEVDPSPLRQAIRASLRGSGHALRAAARRLRRVLGGSGTGAPDGELSRLESELPPGLTERLLRALSAQSRYLEELRRRFREDPGTPSG